MRNNPKQSLVSRPSNNQVYYSRFARAVMGMFFTYPSVSAEGTREIHARVERNHIDTSDALESSRQALQDSARVLDSIEQNQSRPATSH